MRNGFVQDWRGFWAVGGLTRFLTSGVLCDSAENLRPGFQSKSEIQGSFPFDCTQGQDDYVSWVRYFFRHRPAMLLKAADAVVTDFSADG
jgi:hypothetical protein